MDSPAFDFNQYIAQQVSFISIAASFITKLIYRVWQSTKIAKNRNKNVAQRSQQNLNNKKAATKSPHRMNMTGKNFNNGQSPTAMVRYLVDPVPNFSQI